MYLDIRGTERSLYPDTVLIGSQDRTPQLVGDSWFPGYTGKVNIVKNADSVIQLRATPDPNNKTTMDRLERNARISSGLVPQMGGESYGALRTGRGIDSLMGAAVDPRVAEIQTIAQTYLAEANAIALDMLRSKPQWAKRKYVVFSGWPGDPGHVTFTPAEHIERSTNVVTYPLPGVDIQGVTVSVGQMIGAGLISLDTGRRIHPWVADAEHEETQRMLDSLDDAMLESIRTRAATGQLPAIDAAAIKRAIRDGASIEEAIERADQAARARQAAQSPEPAEGEAVPPAMMPGLAMPGEGAESQPPPEVIGPPPAALDQFRENVRAWRSPQYATGPSGPPRPLP
jgi:hypothetical protein